MHGKTVLVTGATNGIGFVTALELARQGANVLLHGRSRERGDEAVGRIKAQVSGAEVTFVEADFAKLASVRAMARFVAERTPKLDVLVNNAGAINGWSMRSADGFELTFAVNHLAHFLLTNLLLENLKAAPSGRVVTVASHAHHGPQVDFEDLNLDRRFGPGRAYQMSKLANILFTRSLARRLAGTGVTANCLHPGVVRTHFAQDNGGILGLGFKILSPFFISPQEGAKTTIFLCTSPDVARSSGAYYDKCRAIRPSPEAQDDAAAEKLWSISDKLVGLSA